jgi:raffinose/stachyose/melibiose transport system permease protein
MKTKRKYNYFVDIIAIVITVIIFIIPFYFMFVNSLKSPTEAAKLTMQLPQDGFHWNNYWEVIKKFDFQIIRAFKNSTILTVFTVIGLLFICSMAGYVIQRRNDKRMNLISWFLMLGLMIPAAILPTINLLQILGIYKTMFGMILIEIGLQIPFGTMLYRGYMSSIPTELEESARIDGCSRFQIFTRIVFPLLKPIHATLIILTAVTAFNDFTNPLYFLPGAKNTTVQLTLFNYKSQFTSSYNLLFADIILITLPMLILFLIFNKKIVDGMVTGAVKG